jgi:cell division protein FtsW
MPKLAIYDLWLFFTAGLLAVAGIFMVGSASQFQAMGLNEQASYFLIRHGLFALAGVCILVVAMNFRYSRLNEHRVVLGLVVVTFVSLIAVLGMPAIGGAHRWFRIGPLSLQPAELAKLTAIVFMARLLARNENEPNDG